MIPSDQFVRFYNEVFKFLVSKGGDELTKYYDRISKNQEYHCLDLYFQFGRRMSREYDYDYLLSRRRELEDAIDEQLRGKREYARRCSECGGVLPYGSRQRLCRACFRKIYELGV